MLRPIRRAAIAAASFVCANGLAAQSTPKTGVEVLERMHDAYAGKWYRTLVFVQKTTQNRGGTPVVTTWYESLRYTDATGTQLRIDIGEPAAGNGVLYTTDSSWRVRGGTLAAATGQGNEFLPMIEGVYMQPVAKTAEQVKALGVDMSKVIRGEWQGRPVWIVGVSSAGDSTSAQFWVDVERNVVVRMIMPGGPRGVMDIHLDDYRRTGGGWLATKIAMLVGGTPVQTEDYSDWKTEIELPAGLFNPATWSTTPHWAKP
jgi:hypothetical protein